MCGWKLITQWLSKDCLTLQPLLFGMTFSKARSRNSNVSLAMFQWKETYKRLASSFGNAFLNITSNGICCNTSSDRCFCGLQVQWMLSNWPKSPITTTYRQIFIVETKHLNMGPGTWWPDNSKVRQRFSTSLSLSTTFIWKRWFTRREFAAKDDPNPKFTLFWIIFEEWSQNLP